MSTLVSKNEQFVDAQAMAKAHPHTFEVPSPEDLANIKIGDSVKICAQRERFWATVTKFDGFNIEAIVDNDLIYFDEHGFHCKDIITFTINNVYSIF